MRFHEARPSVTHTDIWIPPSLVCKNCQAQLQASSETPNSDWAAILLDPRDCDDASAACRTGYVKSPTSNRVINFRLIINIPRNRQPSPQLLQNVYKATYLPSPCPQLHIWQSFVIASWPFRKLQPSSRNVPYNVQLTCQHFQALTDFISPSSSPLPPKAHPDNSTILFCTN